MLKVLHIDTGLTYRGGQRQVALLINTLAGRNIEQYLACPQKSPLIEKTAQSVKKHLSVSESNLGRIYERKDLKFEIEQLGIDIIHAHDSHAHSFAVLLRYGRNKPHIVVTRRSAGQIGLGSKTKYTGHNIHYIAISEYIKRILLKGGVNENIKVVFSAVDDIYFDIERNKEEFASSGDDKKIILSMGAFEKEKGFIDALKTVKDLRELRNDFKYIIVGDGPQKKKLVKFIKDNNMAEYVEIEPWVADTRQYLKEAFLYLAPSHREGLGIAVLEAMASGLPIAAGNIPAMQEIVGENESGLLFMVADTESMKKSLNHFLDDPEIAFQTGVKGRKAAEQYRRDKMAEEIFQLYRHISAD